MGNRPDNREPEDVEEELVRATEGIPRTGLMVFCPHRLVRSVVEIKVEELQSRNIQGVILDLDNTLVRWQKEEMTEEVTAWLETLKSSGIRLCILSNSILGKRSERIAARLGCSNIRLARKPSARGFRRAMEALDATAASTAIVGDQMFTDIWGGNRAGIYTIMVHPIHRREFLYTRFISRPPERLLLRWFRKKGRL